MPPPPPSNRPQSVHQQSAWGDGNSSGTFVFQQQPQPQKQQQHQSGDGAPYGSPNQEQQQQQQQQNFNMMFTAIQIQQQQLHQQQQPPPPPPSGSGHGQPPPLYDSAWGAAPGVWSASDQQASPSVEMRGVQYKDTWSPIEMCSICFSWLCCLYLWFCLFFAIPYCEGKKNNLVSESFCDGFYGKYKVDDSSSYRSDVTVKFVYHWYFWLIFSVVYVGYFTQACASPTRRYLSNVHNDMCAYLDSLRVAQPELWWSIQCYHYETTYYTDSKGNRKSRQRRVNTHSAKSAWSYSRSDDISDTLLMSSLAPVNRTRLELDVKFGDDASQAAYQSAFASFVAANDRDTHKEVHSGTELEGFVHYVLSFRDGEASRPCFMNLGWFWLFTVLPFSPLYRHYMMCASTSNDHDVKKKVWQ